MKQTEAKKNEIANVDEELATLLAKSEKLQETENAGDPVRADYILLAKNGSKALKPSQKDLYIDGLKIGDFYLQKEKKNLGDELKVVPLAFITLYNEVDMIGLNAKFFGVWNKEQALTFPLADGSFFDRQLPNGHYLTPVNWVMVKVLKHDDIESPVIAYKRTGLRIWKAWKDDAKQRSGSCATLVYKIFGDTYGNSKGQDWLDINFEYLGNLLEKEDKSLALACLKKSNEIRESYNRMFGNHDIATLQAPKAPQALIADASEVEDSDDDEEELGF